MIVLKGTLAQVQHDLAVINTIASAWWAAQGYTVIDTPSGKAVVGKNAETEEDNQEALTTTWDYPKPVEFTVDLEGAVIPAIDTEWYITSPTGDGRFYLWRDYIPDGVTIQCSEVEMVT